MVERLPVWQFRARLGREYGLALWHSVIIGLVRLAAYLSRKQYEILKEDIRGSPMVHADKTG